MLSAANERAKGDGRVGEGGRPAREPNLVAPSRCFVRGASALLNILSKFWRGRPCIRSGDYVVGALLKHGFVDPDLVLALLDRFEEAAAGRKVVDADAAYSRRADIPLTSRGAAAAATRIVL